MKLIQKMPILAFSLITLTVHIYCANSGNPSTSHVITMQRDGMSGSSSEDSPIASFPTSPMPWESSILDDLRGLPDDESDESSLTSHQLAHHYLSHFQGNTSAAMPHLVAILENDKRIKTQLASYMHKTTRGGVQPLFVAQRELIHARTPRGPTRNFLDDMNTALPIAQELVDPVVQALTNTSEKLATTEQEKTDLTVKHEALKANSNYKAAGWTALGSAASFLIAAGLSIGSTYIGSLATSAQTVECIVTLANATLGV